VENNPEGKDGEGDRGYALDYVQEGEGDLAERKMGWVQKERGGEVKHLTAW
jgi:hypothetical protein